MTAAARPSPASNPPQAVGNAESYRRLTASLRALLREQTVTAILDRVTHDLRDLIDCHDVVIWQLRNRTTLVPVVIDGEDAAEMRTLHVRLGEGITGAAVKQRRLIVSNNAHTDARAGHVPGTTIEPEAILCVPLIARSTRLGALSLYRRGNNRAFDDNQVDLAEQFADIAALALDNARTLTRLKQLAATDELTGLANRRQFNQELRRATAAADRHRTPLSLLLLDLDNFKRINDTYGHDTGDQVLRQFGAVLRGRLRDTDTPARTGGDEFAVILPHTGERAARRLAHDLERAILNESPLLLGVSIGVARYTGRRELLLREADQRLYAKKQPSRAKPPDNHRRRG
jgi:diguanylate cyclase (GGDEF)-like protein